jgi:hypothetical protein
VALSSVGVWLILTLFFIFTTIEAGHVGLVRTFGNCAGTMNPGWNSKLPCQSVEEADVRVQSKHTHPAVGKVLPARSSTRRRSPRLAP